MNSNTTTLNHFRLRPLTRSFTLPLVACLPLLLTACDAPEVKVEMSTGEPAAVTAMSGDTISGLNMPNPNPTVTQNWGDLPAGREWGSTAGIDIDPTDGNIVAYERCGAGNFGSGVPINCDTNPVDPIFKFDRNTGEILANFGGGLMMTPHGIDVDSAGNVWVTDFAGNAEGTKGHQVHKFSATGELLMSLGVPGQTGTDGAHFNQPNDVIVGPDG